MSAGGSAWIGAVVWGLIFGVILTLGSVPGGMVILVFLIAGWAILLVLALLSRRWAWLRPFSRFRGRELVVLCAIAMTTSLTWLVVFVQPLISAYIRVLGWVGL